MPEVYDVIIIGGGPAGLTASLYTARARYRTLVLERLAPGGQVATTAHVENYPGFPQGMNGVDLSLRMLEQAERFGAEVMYDEIERVELGGPVKVIHGLGGTYEARAVIVASGASPRRLGVTGEEKFVGAGVSYCATCDGALYGGKRVVVVGGADSAVEEASFLTRFAAQVTIVHRRDQLRATPIIVERALANPKIQIMYDTVLEAIYGERAVTSVAVRNVKSNATETIAADGVFVYIGLVPNTGFLRDSLPMDQSGYVLASEHDLSTALAGVFVAGDVRPKSFRQVATAVGDGALAANSVEKYLSGVTKHE
ncbi:MAG: Thioredoxin reductase [Firmicutes bacterium]|nr:Thioredoxin reductase [Bacillota bacterium]